MSRANLLKAIRRRRKRLVNSMAHTPRPRPADLERWRAMESEIERLEAEYVLTAPGTCNRGVSDAKG